MGLMKTLIKNIQKQRILVVGDIMLDHYVWGDATRISPEAPVPVVSVMRDTSTVGGAANVALNLATLGAHAELCGRIGMDTHADDLTQILMDHGVCFDRSIWASDAVSTIIKTRVIVQQQQLCRIDRENPPHDYCLDDACYIDYLRERIKDVDAVIASDYAKGCLDENIWNVLREETRKSGALLALDPKPLRKLETYEPDLMTPNRKESLELAGIDIEPHDPFPRDEVCHEIYQKFKPKLLVITLGAEGMLLCREGRFINQIPTLAQDVFDVSGAGDTVISVLTAALATGATLEDAAHLANTAAGIVVGKFGTATVSTDELLSKISMPC